MHYLGCVLCCDVLVINREVKRIFPLTRECHLAPWNSWSRMSEPLYSNLIVFEHFSLTSFRLKGIQANKKILWWQCFISTTIILQGWHQVKMTCTMSCISETLLEMCLLRFITPHMNNLPFGGLGLPENSSIYDGCQNSLISVLMENEGK